MKIFIAGTDTDVGKTFVTSAICASLLRRGLHVGVMKWAGTGGAETNPDMDFVVSQAAKAALSPGSRLSVSCPYNFSFPASPHLAAAMEGRRIDPERILQATERMAEECDVLLIEGVGGLMVPLHPELLLVDLMAQADCPVILVARAGLGTINHTLLSVEALENRHIPLYGVILNFVGFGGGPDGTDERIVSDNRKVISDRTGVPVYGPLPFSEAPLSEGVMEAVEPLGSRMERELVK